MVTYENNFIKIETKTETKLNYFNKELGNFFS